MGPDESGTVLAVPRTKGAEVTNRVVSCVLILTPKEASMHAVVVRVNIDDSEAATARLREEVVPRVSQAPGFVAGYWTRKDDTGLSMLVFESEEAATNAEERVRANMPDAVTLESTEVREVVANA
jgi:hypothetical protein